MDQFYYESGYIDQSYFVYTADAESAQTITTSIACDASIIAGGMLVDGTGSWMSNSSVAADGNLVAGGAVAMNSSFSQTAMISHIEGADLFAMSNAALSAEVSRIRDNNTAATAVFSIATDASRTRNYSSDDSAAFIIVADSLRVRYQEAALDAAFSMSTTVDKILSVSASLNVSATTSAIPDNLVKSVDIGLVLSTIVSAKLTQKTEYWVSSTTDDFIASAHTSTGDLIAITSNYKIQKINKYGELLSQYSFSSTISKLVDIVIDSNDDIFILGENTAADIFVTKLNSSFQIQWQKAQAAIAKTVTAQKLLLKSTELFVTGTVGGIGFYGPVSKSTGIISSSRYESGQSTTTYKDIHPASLNSYDSAVYIVQENSGGFGSIGTLHKRGTASNWTKSFSTSNTQHGSIVSSDTDSDLNIILLVYETTASGSVPHVIKISSGGNLIWSKAITGASELYTQSVKIVDNIIFVIGKTGGNTFVISLNSDGNLVYQNTLDRINLTENSQPIDIFNDHILIGSASLPQNGSGTGVYDTFLYSSSSAISLSSSPILVYDTSPFIYSNTSITTVNSSVTLTSDSIMGTSIEYIENYGSTVLIDASLLSAFTQTINAGKSVDSISSLISNATLASNSGINKSVNANLQSNGFTTVAVGRIRSFVDIEVSIFNLNASGTVTKSTSVTLDSEFTTSASVSPLRSTSVEFVTTSTLTTDINRLASLAANVSAPTAMSAAVDVIRYNTIALQSQGFVVAAFGRIRPFVDIEVSTFNLAADAFVGKVAASELISESFIDVTATKDIGPITAALESTVDFVVYGELFPSGSVTMLSNSSMSVNANRLRGFASQDTVTSTLGITQRVLRGFASALEISTDLTAVAYKIKQFNSELTAFTAELTVINKIGNPLVHLPAVSTLTTNAIVTMGNVIVMESVSSVDTATKVNKPFNVVCTVGSTVAVVAESGIIGGSTMTVNSTMSVAAITVQTATVNTTAQASLNATATRIRPGISIEWSLGTMSVSAGVIRQAAGQFTAIASSSITAVKKFGGAAHLQCQGFELVIARVINLDASIIYVVPAENRIWTVVPETRVWTVPSETRTYKIKG